MSSTLTVETVYCQDVTNMVRPGETATGPAERMGSRIRELRHTDGLTLVQLAQRTGLSHSFLSQVERGLAQPSMSSLHRIAQALRTTQDKLIAGDVAEDAGPPVALLRADEGVTLPLADHGSLSSARQLPAEPGSFYPTEFVIDGRAFAEFYRHEGNEFLYLAEGAVEVELDQDPGERLFTLGPGDSLRYPGHVPHRWRRAGRRAARLLMVHTEVRGNR
jgi:transcriptional regulator with XRE-family HTH domain